jgi:hypothetical protein
MVIDMVHGYQSQWMGLITAHYGYVYGTWISSQWMGLITAYQSHLGWD